MTKFFLFVFAFIIPLKSYSQLRTYINIALGSKHTLDYYNDPSKQLGTPSWQPDLDYSCHCGSQATNLGIVQELNKNYSLELDYTRHYKFLYFRVDKPLLISGLGEKQYSAEKTSVKLYRTWHLNKHWQWNIGIGYRILWNYLSSYGYPFANDVIMLSGGTSPVTEEQIKQGYQQLAFSSITKFNNYNRYHLLTTSTALEYKLHNNLTFFMEGALDHGFRRISNTDISYKINNGAINEAKIWDKGNVIYFYFGTKLPMDWLWHNNYVKELFKEK